MIRFYNVTKKYKDKTVLNHINLEIAEGEFVSIVGPSGAGKSTLLHTIIGAVRPSGGSVEVNGIVINDLEGDALQLYRRTIGVVYQDYKLLPKKTMKENIAFALEVCGSSEKEVQKRVAQVLALVNLEDVANHFPQELSGGEQQRAAIARSLVHSPSIVLADEPTGNLDPENTWEIIRILREINKEGITVLLATHDESIIKRFQKRVIRIEDGQVV